MFVHHRHTMATSTKWHSFKMVRWLVSGLYTSGEGHPWGSKRGPGDHTNTTEDGKLTIVRNHLVKAPYVIHFAFSLPAVGNNSSYSGPLFSGPFFTGAKNRYLFEGGQWSDSTGAIQLVIEDCPHLSIFINGIRPPNSHLLLVMSRLWFCLL